MIEFIFVRHGETDKNKEGILQGHLDIPLNKKGIGEAVELGKFLGQLKFDLIFSSDLTRALQCAKEIQKNFPYIEIKKEPLLRERFFGEHQGKRLTDLGYKDVSYGEMVKHLYECECPRGESNMLLLGRIKRFLVSEKLKNKNLVVTHGGVVMLTLNYLLKEKIRFENNRQHKNGYVSYLKLDDDFKVVDSLVNVHVSEVVDYLG
jgi:alpha-ribazole phosphatase